MSRERSNRNQPNSSQKSSSGYYSGKFINVKLNETDKEKIHSILENPLELINALDSLLSESYRLSQAYDYNNSSFIATLYDREPKSQSFEFTLAGRGSTPAHARASLAYKHFNYLGRDWSNALGENSPGDLSEFG